MEHSRKTNLIVYASLLLLSLVFLLIHSESTSPLFVIYGGDSANYLVMGKMLLHGMTPYLDFFDHKGPMMFFIEALAQIVVKDRLGVFILQVVTMTVSLSLMYHIARLFQIGIKSCITIICFVLLFLTFTIQGGNMTEEYSLPFLLYSIYLAARVLLDKKLSMGSLFIMGVCAGILLWIRLNNTSVALASFLFIVIAYLRNQDFKTLGRLLIFYIAGFLLIGILVTGYFYLNDALYQMVFAAFIYNIKYVGINASESPFGSIITTMLYLFKAWLPLAVLILGTILYYTKVNYNSNVIWLSGLLLVIGYGATHVGAAYHHYMMLNIPLLLLGCIYLHKASNTSNVYITNGMLVAFAVLLIGFTYHRFKQSSSLNEVEKYYNAVAQDVVSQIPDSDRNSIYAYQTMTKFHAVSGTYPCFKYFMMQEWQSQYNPSMRVETNQMMQHNPPKWLITQFRDMSTNAEFWEIVSDKYDLAYKNNLFELFRLKQ